jgi:hypothetical protein
MMAGKSESNPERDTTTLQVYKADAEWLKTRQRQASFTTQSGMRSRWIPMFDLVHELIEYVREAESGEGI